jgi:histidine ammonia-lyase
VDVGDSDRNPQRIPPQDPYSLRCAPQVHGSILATLRFVHETIAPELNAATDNPLIFTDNSDLNRDYRTVSGGNFHGEPIALAMDYLGIAMTELGSIAERRIFKMTDYHFGKPETKPDATPAEAEAAEKGRKIAEATELQDFLIDEQTGLVGLSSGFMIAQYTAASLVSDCKTLAHPDSVDSIPSSANKEDHVSMSLNAARHARMIVDNVEAIIAIELLSAAQAIDLQSAKLDCKPGAATAEILGEGTKGAYRLIREHIPYLDHDRVLVHDVRRMIHLMRSGDLVRAVGDEVWRPDRAPVAEPIRASDTGA